MGILLVEDNEDLQALVKMFLTDAGYADIVMVSSAQEAFKVLGIDRPEGAALPAGVDLILMDYMLPGMDGIEACRKIKQAKHMETVPVIMVTAVKDPEVLDRAFSAGAVDYITKPIQGVELLARIRSALKLKHETDRRRTREAELVGMTRRDALTGIANRGYFDEVAAKEYRRAARLKLPLSLIMLDIDDFKAFNDTYGHLRGDEGLKSVAQAIQAVLNRPGDVAARYGGEEFVVILPGTGTAGALSLAESIRQRLEALNIPHAGSAAGRLTLSLGVAGQVPEPKGNVLSLVAAVDEALYRAKAQGKNRVVLSEKFNG